MDDEVERLRAKKQSYVETEREAGPEFGEECGTDDVEYCALLRIASAVDEVSGAMVAISGAPSNGKYASAGCASEIATR
jgi:hypothetical protein